MKLPLAVCVDMVHMIFLGSSKGTHIAPNEMFKLTYPVNVQSLCHLVRTRPSRFVAT